MPDFYSVPLTEAEFEALVVMMAERLKNVVYATADANAREVLDQMRFQPGTRFHRANRDRNITLTFTITLVENDLAEIVAGLRRAEEEVGRGATETVP